MAALIWQSPALIHARLGVAAFRLRHGRASAAGVLWTICGTVTATTRSWRASTCWLLGCQTEILGWIRVSAGALHSIAGLARVLWSVMLAPSGGGAWAWGWVTASWLLGRQAEILGWIRVSTGALHSIARLTRVLRSVVLAPSGCRAWWTWWAWGWATASWLLGFEAEVLVGVVIAACTLLSIARLACVLWRVMFAPTCGRARRRDWRWWRAWGPWRSWRWSGRWSTL